MARKFVFNLRIMLFQTYIEGFRTNRANYFSTGIIKSRITLDLEALQA